MATVDTGIGHRAFDVGAGAGFVRYYGMPAVPFNHPMYHLRLTIKPLALVSVSQLGSPNRSRYRAAVLDRYKEDALQVRLEMNVVPGGIDDAYFGAIPGTLSADLDGGYRARLDCRQPGQSLQVVGILTRSK